MDDLEELEDIEIIYSDDEDDHFEMEEDPETRQTETEIEIKDMSLLTFANHQKSVFATDVSKDDVLAVTGGEDDIAFVWNTDSGDILFDCKGHKDSVTEVAFNLNNKYLATGDMAGMIQIWNVKEKKLAWCLEADDMEWLMWHPLINVIMCGCQTGNIYIWEIPSKNCKVLPSPGFCPCTSGKVLAGGKHLLTSYGNGHVKMWALKEGNIMWTNSDNATVNNIEINCDDSLIVVIPSGKIIRASDGKTMGTVMLDGQIEIEAALFSKDSDIIITGSLSGQLCVWQLGKYTIRHQAKIDCAVTVLRWSHLGNAIIGTTDGDIYICNPKSGTLVQTLTGHRSDILSISVFNNANKILTSSDDGSAKIFILDN
ncbi:angio-associated migratory cell protein [Cylas formicarius]|uniref:angio-associated migratory cell protein n=1 Tax=Cylas formicarius TaxID=197179 RepID=UPI0029589E74|nr:angio-associated migratory cell protein [Cylas formicarius]